MNIEIIQGGRVLRQHHHNGEVFAETPESGEYEIRLTNNSALTRMAVVSVDGENVIDGKLAGLEGSGYVLSGWQSITIKGYLRSNAACARFTFSTPEESYAAGMGHGTKNTGVIGVAVFDEQPQPVTYRTPSLSDLWGAMRSTNAKSLGGGTYGSNSGSMGLEDTDSFSMNSGDTMCSTAPGVRRSAVDSTRSRVKSSIAPKAARDTATAYGREEAYHTQTVAFVRASASPSRLISLRYGTVAKLREWGVPIAPVVNAPNPFPASQGFAQPPPGWTSGVRFR